MYLRCVVLISLPLLPLPTGGFDAAAGFVFRFDGRALIVSVSPSCQPVFLFFPRHGPFYLRVYTTLFLLGAGQVVSEEFPPSSPFALGFFVAQLPPYLII